MKTEIIVDNELSALCPALSDEEFAGLEQSILKNGCRVPLDVWRQGKKDVLLDGHHRLQICQTHDIKFKTMPVAVIATRADAREWIIRNQFDRRNLAPYARAELALELEPIIRAKAKENLAAGGGDKKSAAAKSGCQTSDKAIEPIDTKKEVAKEAGLSHDTIAKAKYIKEHASEKVKAKLRKGETTINMEYGKLKGKEESSPPKKKKKALWNRPTETIMPVPEGPFGEAWKELNSEVYREMKNNYANVDKDIIEHFILRTLRLIKGEEDD